MGAAQVGSAWTAGPADRVEYLDVCMARTENKLHPERHAHTRRLQTMETIQKRGQARDYKQQTKLENLVMQKQGTKIRPAEYPTYLRPPATDCNGQLKYLASSARSMSELALPSRLAYPSPTTSQDSVLTVHISPFFSPQTSGFARIHSHRYWLPLEERARPCTARTG